jgi:hypothetical protein
LAFSKTDKEAAEQEDYKKGDPSWIALMSAGL